MLTLKMLPHLPGTKSAPSGGSLNYSLLKTTNVSSQSPLNKLNEGRPQTLAKLVFMSIVVISAGVGIGFAARALQPEASPTSPVDTLMPPTPQT